MDGLVRLLAALLFLAMAPAAWAQEEVTALFGGVSVPSAGSPSSFGTYARGCIGGAVKLPETTAGWQAMKPSRNRYWGHPAMIEFINRLSAGARRAGWPGIYVGDIGQPRGGPMKSGHRSHQIGLDVDVWLRKPTEWRELSRSERDAMGSYVVVADDGVNLNSYWTDSHEQVLKAAAEDPAVARIFINAAIKRWICEKERGPDGRVDAPWLRKLRPWKGHNAHFHVRLNCPPDSKYCEEQGAPPPGPGCGAELAKWFPGGESRKDETINAPSEEEQEGSKYTWAGKKDPAAPGGATDGATRGFKTRALGSGLDEMPAFCRAVLTDNAAALAQINAYESVAIVQPKLSVFFQDTAEAQEAYIGTPYFWRPEVDLVAARERNVGLTTVGDLPPGLEFIDRGNGNGVLTGTPTEPGEFGFSVVAVERGSETGRQVVTLKVFDPEKGGLPPRPQDPLAPDAATVSLEHQVKDFLTEFTGDECFLAVPYEIAEAGIKIEAFADDAAPVIDFDRSFLKAIGIEARIGGRLITQSQCPALAFVRTYPYGNPAPVEVDDEDREVAEGDTITVAVAAARVRTLSLLLIGPDGTVVDLTDYLARRGNRYAVTLRATGKGPQVLVAVDTVVPIPAEQRRAAAANRDIFSMIDTDALARELDPRASVALILVK